MFVVAGVIYYDHPVSVLYEELSRYIYIACTCLADILEYKLLLTTIIERD
jgi:hypothetical protein